MFYPHCTAHQTPPVATKTPKLQLWRGIFLFMLALFVLACMDTTTKFLIQHHEVPVVIAGRYLVHLSLMLIFLLPVQGKQLIKTQRTGLVWVRAISLAVTSLFLGLALQRMPIAETTGIVFLAPLLVVIFARPVLGERIGTIGWIAVIMGCIGMLLIVRPSSGLDTLGIIFGLCAATGLMVYQLLSRMLASTENTMTLLFYAALAGALGFGVMMPWFAAGIKPTMWDALLFISVGFYSGLGHFLFTAAYRYASASLLAPITYLQLLWAGLLGWFVFGHVPDLLSILGMCIVAFAGVLVALKSSFRTETPATTRPILQTVLDNPLVLDKSAQQA